MVRDGNCTRDGDPGSHNFKFCFLLFCGMTPARLVGVGFAVVGCVVCCCYSRWCCCLLLLSLWDDGGSGEGNEWALLLVCTESSRQDGQRWRCHDNDKRFWAKYGDLWIMRLDMTLTENCQLLRRQLGPFFRLIGHDACLNRKQCGFTGPGVLWVVSVGPLKKART